MACTPAACAPDCSTGQLSRGIPQLALLPDPQVSASATTQSSGANSSLPCSVCHQKTSIMKRQVSLQDALGSQPQLTTPRRASNCCGCAGHSSSGTLSRPEGCRLPPGFRSRCEQGCVARQNSCAAGAGRTTVTGTLLAQGTAPSAAGHGTSRGCVCTCILIAAVSCVTLQGRSADSMRPAICTPWTGRADQTTQVTKALHACRSAGSLKMAWLQMLPASAWYGLGLVSDTGICSVNCVKAQQAGAPPRAD